KAPDHRPLHFGVVVAKTDRIDKFAGPFVVFWIERVDMADTAAHEEENDRFRLRLQIRREESVLDFASLGPKRAHGQASKTAAELVKETAARDATAGIDFGLTGHTRIHPD